MSCFFCDSFFHLSQSCTVYISDKARKEVARLKKCCEDCIAPLNEKHNDSSYLAKRINLDVCKFNQKCLICFSRTHHTVFCPDRDCDPNIVVPNIDMAVLPRFLQFLDLFERFWLALVSSEALKLSHLEPIEIVENIQNNYNVPNYLFGGKLSINYCCNQPFTTIMRPKIIILYFSTFSAENFLHFLTYNTKSLICNNVKITPNIKLENILKAAPNLQDLQLYRSNIEISESWAEDFMKYKNGKKFKKLVLKLKITDLNIPTLASLIKKKCEKNVEIILNIQVNGNKNRAKLMQNIYEFFQPAKIFQDVILELRLVIIKNEGSSISFETHCFSLK